MLRIVWPVRRAATWIGMGVGLSLLPVACLSGYVFDLPPGSGGSTAASSGSHTTVTSSSTAARGSSTTTTTSSGVSNGGSSATSTTSGPSSSSSSGSACAVTDCSIGCGACVPTTPPAGWTGYFSLFDGPPSKNPNTCVGAFPTQGYAGNADLDAGAASCPCKCSPPDGGTCQMPALDIDDGNCSGTVATVCTGNATAAAPSPYTFGDCWNLGTDPQGGDYIYGGSLCGPQSSSGGTCGTGTQPCDVSVKAAQAIVLGGGCTPIDDKPVLPDPGWMNQGLACGGATPGTGCGAGTTCLPLPPAPFASGVCIMQSGVVPCPSTQFTEQHIFYTGTNDTRSCSACVCGSPAGSTCEVTFNLYDDEQDVPAPCNTPTLTVVSNTCTDLSGNPDFDAFSASISVPVNGGSCTAVPGTPTGSDDPDPTTATTFCCVQ